MHDTDPSKASSAHNLKRLFSLRILTVSGELLAVLALHYVVGIALPLSPLLAVIAALALFNLWTWRRIHRAGHISDYELFMQLAIDVFAFTAFLYFTGGASNPFAWFYLIPLIIAATVLSPRATWSMAVLTTSCYTLLMFFYRPLSGNDHMHHSENFAQHVFGMWFGFVLSAVLIAWFVVGMASTLRKRDRLLAEVREQTLRDEQLVALGTLATGAAHELGTPLATMAVVTRELQREDVPGAMQRKLTILSDQVERCKRALSVISASAGETRAESGSLVPVENFLADIVDSWKSQHLNTAIDLKMRKGPPSAQIVDEYTLHQCLINLLNNAADASSDPLLLKAHWNQNRLTIDILDRGPGLRPGISSTLGERKTSQKEYGMGLGLFLTHATLRRMGGAIELFDRDGGGTCTHIELPLANFSLQP